MVPPQRYCFNQSTTNHSTYPCPPDPKQHGRERDNSRDYRWLMSFAKAVLISWRWPQPGFRKHTATDLDDLITIDIGRDEWCYIVLVHIHYCCHHYSTLVSDISLEGRWKSPGISQKTPEIRVGDRSITSSTSTRKPGPNHLVDDVIAKWYGLHQLERLKWRHDCGIGSHL